MPLTHLRSIPLKEITAGLRTVPNVAADLTTTDSVIFQISLANISAGAVTLTIKDRAGSPKSLMEAVSIAANTTYVIAFPEGVWMTGGINWVASAANSLNAEVYGTFKG